MSGFNHLFDLPEQICHVQCGFCTTILLVSVPFSSLSMVVTVRCGHCTSLLSVNMTKASFIPLHLLASLTQNEDEEGTKEEPGREEEYAFGGNLENRSVVNSSDNEEEVLSPAYQIVNKPPEKRQRAPSAYNCFIKEEIRRLKSQNPSMTHKEAFSAAAKNWAHLNSPMVHNGDEDIGGQEEQASAWNNGCGNEQKTSTLNSFDSTEIEEDDNGFRDRKAARNSIGTKSPFE